MILPEAPARPGSAGIRTGPVDVVAAVVMLAHRRLEGVLQLVLFVVLGDGRSPKLPGHEEADDEPEIADPGEGGPPAGGGRAATTTSASPSAGRRPGET